MTITTYETSPRQESKVGSLLFWLCWHGAALLIVLVLLLVIVPRFEKMFQEIGLKLPLASVLVINLSRSLSRFGFLIIPLGLVFDVAMLFLLTVVGGLPRWLRHLWCRGVLIMAVCIVLLVAIAVFLPLLGLLQGLR